MHNLLSFIICGALQPSDIDGEYGEYNSETFTLLLSMKQISQLQ